MRILFSSANNLLDPSSGAAISVRTLLRLLSEAGMTCRSLTAATYDRATSAASIENMTLAGAVPTDPGAPLAALWRVADGAVVHEIMPVARPGRLDQTSADERRLLEFAIGVLDEFRPEVILTYGGGLFERQLVQIAQERGIVTVFYLANPGYKTMRAFENIDRVFTDTRTTRDLYVERLGIDPYAIGKFIDRPRIPLDARPEFVTFVNPSFEKGVTLFYRIAELAAQTAPAMRFLVVESRATLRAIEQRTGMRFSSLDNIESVGLQRDMAEVFSRTRVLLLPSLWHESGPRTPIEAMSLGIPIVATDRGGIPEVLGEAGITISPPAPLVDNHRLIPPLLAAVPWVETLRQLLDDPAEYAVQRQRSLAGWAAHDPSERIGDIIGLLRQLVAAKRGPTRA